MNTYVLSGRDSTTMTLRGPLQVRLAQEGPPRGAELRVLRADGSTHPADRPSEDVLILRSVEHGTVVRVAPSGAAMFPDGVRIGLRLLGVGGSDEVVLRTMDVAGLAHRDLVRLDDTGHRTLSVTALDARTEEPVGPLQAAARTAARAVLGVDRVADTDLRHVVVVVDPTASMAAPLADGGVEAAVDVLAGMALVVGRDGPPRVCIAGREPVWLPPDELRGLGARVAAEVLARGLECGLRPDPDRMAVAPDGLVHLVTDAVPVELPAGWSVLAAGPGHPSPPARCSALPAPRDGRTVVEHLLARPHLLETALRPLLAAPAGAR